MTRLAIFWRVRKQLGKHSFISAVCQIGVCIRCSNVSLTAVNVQLYVQGGSRKGKIETSYVFQCFKCCESINKSLNWEEVFAADTIVFGCFPQCLLGVPSLWCHNPLQPVPEPVVRTFMTVCVFFFVRTFSVEVFTKTEPHQAELVALTLSCTLRSRNSCSMAEFRVKCLTYTHSRARPAPSLTSPG